MHGWSHWGRGFMGFRGGGMIMMGLWLVLVVGLIIFLVKKFSDNSSHNYRNNYETNDKEDPLKIAEKRYAKGEIDKEELQEIKKELRE